MWRQGDVLIAAIAELPETATPVTGVILVRGEATGHAHRIADPNAAALFMLNNTMYLRVTAETAEIVHDEHKPVRLPKGLYRVWQQREYSPNSTRTVFD